MVERNDASEGPRVALLGTGIMGSAMARRLIAAHVRTTVWDRSPSVTVPLREAGAMVAASPETAVSDADVVITMLPTADVVNDVMFGGDVTGAFSHGAVWAQMGTIGPDATRALAERLGNLRPDVVFVDAPVSGVRGRPRPVSSSSWPPVRPKHKRSWSRPSQPSAAKRSGSVRPAREAA